MSNLSIEEKIQLMQITARLILVQTCAFMPEDNTIKNFTAAYKTLKSIALENADCVDPELFTYAVVDHGDGTADLTIYEEGTAACITLDPESMGGMVARLAECLDPENGKALDPGFRNCVQPYFSDDETAFERFCSLAALFIPADGPAPDGQ
ncbi:MAG TPA: hypothetical protein DHV36_22190 [Desulfobacteraceae bacterium]|nr:hypothetical protein [Desulfobacteraceae bacterium]